MRDTYSTPPENGQRFERVPIDRAFSVRALAKKWAVGTAKIRAMIRQRKIRAIDVGAKGRCQLRILPEEVRRAEARLAVAPPPPPRRRSAAIDPEVAALLDD
jgi:hypothetical protein